MRKNLLIAVLLLGLVAALSNPAAAAKKKKKKVKPYKSETVTIQAGHGAFYGASGTVVAVTAQEFLQTCAIPNSNGVDAWVFEVPKTYQKINSTLEAIGTTTNTTVGYDLDVFLYDKECKQVGVFQSEGTDEFAMMKKGTSYILVHAYEGNPVDAYIKLKAAK